MRYVLSTYLCIVLILISLFPAGAQTVLPGVIEESTHLNRTNSPYLINGSVTISEPATLTVEAGVQILMGKNASFINNGRCILQGNANNSIRFEAQNSGESWRYITNNGTFIAQFVESKNAVRFISSNGDSLVLKNCNVSETTGAIGDDCISAHNTPHIVIAYCQLIGDQESSRIDAIDLDGVSNVRIENCVISNFPDDAIDIGSGSSNVQILGNTISNCDMGVSVGESSTAVVNKNLIIRCSAGIQSHTKAIVTADQNTLFENNIGIRALHYDSQPTSYGTVNISNSIFSNCLVAAKLVTNSVVTFDYCLSDGETLSGNSNTVGEVGFVDPENGNFHLSSTSAAIDAGDVNAKDVDGTRLDLGVNSRFNAPLIINEISPSNLSINADEANEYDDWVELLNTTDQPINLNGYYFSDNPEKLLKGHIDLDIIINGGETLLLWADDSLLQGSTHLPFGLSGNGEYFSITNPNGQIVDSVSFPVVPVDHTFGRHPEGRNWVYFDHPTPSEENSSIAYSERAGDVIFSDHGGAVSATTLSLKSTHFNEFIYYSTNGANPGLGNPFSDPISINATTTIRAVASEKNKLPGFKQSRLIFQPGTTGLPVLSLSMNEDDLYGDKGIYTNYKRSSVLWERPVSLSYYKDTFQWAANGGIRIQGGNSVFMPKKAFRLFFRSGYGDEKLRFTPFKSGPKSFENLVLRSGYDDDITTSGGTLLRDPFSAELWKKMGETATESDFVTLYLNNNYWGVYNIRESINDAFVISHLNTKNFDLIRFLKTGESLKYGRLDSWNTLIQYFNTTDFTQPKVYDEVSEFVDMNSMLNLLAFVHCSAFRSWTWGTFGMKPTNGKWSWTIWDTDRGFSLSAWNGFTEYANTSAEKWSNIIPQKLIKNEKFQHALINRNCDLLNTKFNPDSAIAVLDSLVAIITPEMEKEYERWKPGYADNWSTKLNSIRGFLKARPNNVYSQMKNYFSLEDTNHIRINIVGNGAVQLNSISISTATFKGVYMHGIPIHLQAIPGKGAKFVGWQSINKELFLTINPEDYTEITAVFEADITNTYESLVINEIMYHPLDADGGEWIEIYNPNNYTMDVSGWMITDQGVGNQFIFENGTAILPNNFLVIAGHLNDFKIKYPELTGVLGSYNIGETGFNLSNSGETVYLYNENGEQEDYVSYMDISPWPMEADGLGASLQLRSTVLDNLNPENWGVAAKQFSTPGKPNYVTPIDNITTKQTSALSIYPNPSKGRVIYLQSTYNFEVNMSLKIMDITGRTLYASKIEHPGNGAYSIHLRGADIQPGTYIFRIQYDVGNSSIIDSKSLIISE